MTRHLSVWLLILCVVMLVPCSLYSAEESGSSHSMKGDDHSGMEHTNAAKGLADHDGPADSTSHEGHDMESMAPDGTQTDLTGHVHEDPPEDSELAGIDEHLGAVIPEGIMFKDEQGRMVDVLSLIDRPTIIAPVYFTCPTVCNLLQSQIAKLLPQLNMDPDEYRVLSVSFDELDTPAIAERKKRQYIAAMDNAYPPESWRFLVGDKESIDKLMGTIGFKFTRTGKDFVHPVALIVTSPEGKVVRYLYGNGFLPFDITMALTEAQSGKVGLSLKRVVAFCFSYDPEGRQYVFNFMRVAGGSVLAGALILFIALTRGGRKRHK